MTFQVNAHVVDLEIKRVWQVVRRQLEPTGELWIRAELVHAKKNHHLLLRRGSARMPRADRRPSACSNGSPTSRTSPLHYTIFAGAEMLAKWEWVWHNIRR